MKSLSLLAVLAAICVSLVNWSVRAEDAAAPGTGDGQTPPAAGNSEDGTAPKADAAGSDQTMLGDRDRVQQLKDLYQKWLDRWEQEHGKDKPDRPRPQLPADIKETLQKYKAEREQFITEQKKLIEQLKTATEQEREALKDTLAAKREEFRTQMKETAKELQARLKEIRAEFKNKERDRIVDSAKEGGKKGR